MKKTCLALPFLLVFSILSAGLAQDDGLRSMLDLARKDVEDKNYVKALEKYSVISDWLAGEPGLMMEWARVYTYADSHKQAIDIFEKVRAQYPQMEKELIRELADQYKWDGQLDKAIETYKAGLDLMPDDRSLITGYAQVLSWKGRRDDAISEYDKLLREKPDDINAMLGKAEVLSWQNKLDESVGLYDRLLRLEPANTAAIAGRARVFVWQGYHRKGIAEYDRLLALDPRNAEALEGLSFAYHWDGRDDLARKTILRLKDIDPSRNEIRKLEYNIINSQQPFVRQFNDYWKDKNSLSARTHGIRSGAHLDDSTSVEIIGATQKIRQNNKLPISGGRSGLGVYRRLSDDFEINSFVYTTDYHRARFEPVTTNTWLTCKPSDEWRFDAAYDRETFEDVDSILNHISVKSGSFSADFRPDRWWFFSGKFKRGFYSDNNRQNSFLGKAEYAFSHNPYAKLYYNYYHSNFSAQLNHGYFNPWIINSHSLGLYSGKDITKKLFVEGQISAGYERQKPISNHPTSFASCGIKYRFTENWVADGRAEYFDARPDHGSRGYNRRSFTLALTYNFGAEHSYMSGSSPSRPATGK